MQSKNPIVRAFGGIRQMARDTGIPAGTVQYWSRVGYVPMSRHEEVRGHADRLGIKIDQADFLVWSAAE